MVFPTLRDVFLHGEDVDLNSPARSIDAAILLYKGLRLLGIDRSKENNRRHVIYAVLLNLVISIYTPTIFILSYILLFDQMEIADFLTSLQVFINEVANVLKVAAIAYYIPRIRNLDTLLEKMDARCVESDEKKIILLFAKKGNRLLVYFGMVYHSYATSTMLNAVYMHKPPYSMYNWPLDWKKSPLDLYIVTIKEYILISFACFQAVINDSYAVIYVGILISHLQALMLRIKKLGRDQNNRKDNNKNTLDLINCILDHKNIIQLYDSIHSPISTTLFIQFIFTAIIISVTVVNIMFFAGPGSIIASLIYVWSVMMRTFVCCYYANCLIEESNAFSDAIFHSNWVDQDANFKKILAYFLHRSQQTITLTAGKLFPINIATFLSIAKFSFSLYTFLKEMDFGQRLQQD